MAPMTGRVFLLITALAITAALMVGGTAFAQSSPASAVYGNSEVLGTVNGGGPADVVPAPGTSGGGGGPASPVPNVSRESGGSPPVATAKGSLPFTGFQAGLVALAG